MPRLRAAVLLSLPLLALGLTAPATAQQPRLRVYLDCPCDFDYVRREIPFVDYVRDRQAADVHLLVTREGSGGGVQYRLTYIGTGRFATVEDTLLYDSSATDSEDRRREGLVARMKLGLMRFVAGTPEADRIRITFVPADTGRVQIPAATPRDPWNYWNFRVQLEGSLEDEAKQETYEVEGRFSANRTTEQWKLSLELDGEQRTQQFELDERTVKFDTHDWRGKALVVRSLGGRWAAGVGAWITSSVYRNFDLALELAPAIEYNVFPYAESSRRVLVVRYYAGAGIYDYEEETLFFETRETLFQQALALQYGARQPWGEASASAQYSNYLHDFAFNRVAVDGALSVNILRGLSVDVRGEYERIRDQLAIPRGDLPDEEVLLNRRQRLTGHQLELSLGLSYRFGSIFNNVVNTRLRDF